MLPGVSAMVGNRHCPACGFDWLSGESLKALLPTVKAFEDLRAAAVASSDSSRRSLQCPTCHTGSLRIVKAAGVLVDVCPRCVGVALDPGELRSFKSIAVGSNKCSIDGSDIITGVDVLIQILTMLG